MSQQDVILGSFTGRVAVISKSETNRLREIFPSQVNGIAVISSGSFYIYGHCNIWRIPFGDDMHDLPARAANITDLRLLRHPDSDPADPLFCTTSEDGLWIISDSRQVICFRPPDRTGPQPPAPLTSLVVLGERPYGIIASSEDGTLSCWSTDLVTVSSHWTIPVSSTAINFIDATTDETTVLAIGHNGTVYFITLSDPWTKEPTITRTFESAHSKYGLKIRLSPDNRLFVTTAADGTAKIWDFATGEVRHTLKRGNSSAWVWDAAFTPDSASLVTCASDGWWIRWNSATGAVERQIPPGVGQPECGWSAVAIRRRN